MRTSQTLRSMLAAMVCGSLVLGALPAEAAVSRNPEVIAYADLGGDAGVGKPKPAAVKALTKEQREAFVLSRLTFGATPDELAQIRRMGVDAWLRRQLQPETISDSALEARLDAYPALRMQQEDRLRRYPEPAMLRQIAKTGVLPNDPEMRAIVGDQVEFYQMAQQAKAAKAQPDAGAMNAGMAGGSPMLTTAQMQQQAAAVNLEQTVQPMAMPQVNEILALSPNDRYGRLLSMPPAELIALRKAARGPLEAKVSDGMTPLQKETLLALSGTNRMINAETQGARLLRDIYSQRQVEAVMTDFWLNHFNVFVGANGQIPSLLPDYEQTVRAHSLGKFEDLLVATAKSPAMLLYLNNSTSAGPNSVAATRQRKNPRAKQDLGLNENYARELMELHTLGVNGGYTQKDVTEVAKVFTGWTLERPYDGGAYTFNGNRHEPGTKTVLGKTIGDGGESEGYAVLHMLATSPAAARFISTELAQRFVNDAPPKMLVDRMAKTFQSSGGDIKAVLWTMVHAPEFFAPENVNAKLKTPLEYVTSAVRASGADVVNPMPLVQSLQQLGMPLYGCQPPTGYKWDEATWLSSSALVNRMNFALTLSTNRIAGAVVDWTPVLASSADAPQKESLLETRLFEAPVSERTRAAVISQGNDATAEVAAAQFSSGSARQLTDAERLAKEQDRADAMMAGRVRPVKGAAGPVRGLGAVAPKVGPAPVDKEGAAMAGLLLGSPEFQRR